MRMSENITGGFAAPAKKVAFISLLALGILEFLLIVCETMWNGFAFGLLDHYSLIPCCLFLGAVLGSSPGAFGKGTLLLGGVMVLWTFLCQLWQMAAGEGMNAVSGAWAAYLLAFPFAACMEDGDRQKGLKAMAWLYTAGSLALSLMGLLLLLAGCLPQGLAERIEWDGARFMAGWHPNITACILMIGTGFAMGFSFETSNKWGKAAWTGAALLQFFMMILTHSRTSVLISCAMLGGLVFLRILRGKNGKRIVVGLLAAAMTAGMLFVLSEVVYDWHYQQRVQEYLDSQQQTEPQSSPDAGEQIRLPSDSGQGTLTGDLKTLNGRTIIWKAAFQAVRYQPMLKWRGTSYVGLTITNNGSFPVDHGHNSWVQVMVRYGVPGLILALVFTWIALTRGIVVMFRGNSTMWQRTVALLTLCLMGTGFLEPYLFGESTLFHFVNVLFFLCTGYLFAWQKSLKSSQ